MRQRLEASRGERDLKRCPGGMIDIEFLAQVLQTRHADRLPGCLSPNTFIALERLEEVGLLTPLQAAQLRKAHAFMSSCLMRLRIVHNRPIDELPGDPPGLDKLRRRLGPTAPANLATHLARLREQTRRLFNELLN